MTLPWDKFLRLQGAATENWERVCREVVRRRYGAFGEFATRKNQPGVEFHVEVLLGGSDLGEAGRHWGWQCKWYEPDAFQTSGRLTAAQRAKVEDAIQKSEKHLPMLTDWVLWTREPL